MAIDFTFPPDIDALRLKVREFIAEVVRPAAERIAAREGDRRFLIQSIIEMRVGPRSGPLAPAHAGVPSFSWLIGPTVSRPGRSER
jgi:hypothetical protein